MVDLKHLLDSSGVGAEIYLDEIPITKDINDVNAGDDYDLCFTVPSKANITNFYKIGEVTKDKSIKFFSEKGYDVSIEGYEHFK